jgi:Xaa-Pro dipeptidase
MGLLLSGATPQVTGAAIVCEEGSTVGAPMSRDGPWAEPYPRFSDDEMEARRRALHSAMRARDLDHIVVYGANRFGSAVGWLTRWPVTREALVVFSPERRDVLFVHFYNHIPNASRIATEADVRWAGDTATTAVSELERRGGRGARIGFIGPLGHDLHRRLSDCAIELVDLNGAYTKLRLVKSPEELEWLRVGASLTDAAVARLQANAQPGSSERALGDIVERAYVDRGATTHIHYFGMTSMSSPGLGVPAQWPSTRALRRGDVLMCEISASFWDHPGQLLRTFAIGAQPTPMYRLLHEVADAAFDAILARLAPGVSAAELVDAASVIEDAGFTTRDDLVHGFVGGYLPPVLGSKSRTLEPVPEFYFERGMTVVVQPNVVTLDESAGVQTGELVLVGDRGPERLHGYDRGLLVVD